jgi:hypothetical protein
MDAVLALVTIAVMTSLAAVAALLLRRMFRTIRDLRGITTGLHDTMRWAVGQVAAAERSGRGPASAEPAVGRPEPSR